MRTTDKRGDGHHEHIMTRKNHDGTYDKMVIWFIGRCWTYTLSGASYTYSYNMDYAGQENEHFEIVRRLRRAFAYGHI